MCIVGPEPHQQACVSECDSLVGIASDELTCGTEERPARSASFILMINIIQLCNIILNYKVAEN